MTLWLLLIRLNNTMIQPIYELYRYKYITYKDVAYTMKVVDDIQVVSKKDTALTCAENTALTCAEECIGYVLLKKFNSGSIGEDIKEIMKSKNIEGVYEIEVGSIQNVTLIVL